MTGRSTPEPIPVRPGIQLERDGKLQCLECGLWYRGLGQHVRMKHGIDPDDYRRAYELPRTFALWSRDLSEAQSERLRVQLAERPEWKAAFRTTRTGPEERARRRAEAQRDSVGRAGVRAARQAAAAEAGRRRKQRLDDSYVERARELGHVDLDALFEATKDLTASGLGELLGVSKAAAAGLRRRHGRRSPGPRAVDRKPRVLRAPEPFRTLPELRPRVPLGVQPEQGGRVQCLDCGRWYRALGNHLRQMHGMSVREYQVEFELPVSRGLVTEELREAMAAHQRRRLAADETLRAAMSTGHDELMRRRTAGAEARAEARRRAGVRRAMRAGALAASAKRSEDIRAKNDERARQHGYGDIVDLLENTVHLTGPELAELLGIRLGKATKLRVRYGIRSQGRARQTDERRRQRELALRPTDVAPGEQPQDSGRLQCLECGRWYRGLGQHVFVHGMSKAEYRRRHELPAEHPLVAEDD